MNRHRVLSLFLTGLILVSTFSGVVQLGGVSPVGSAAASHGSSVSVDSEIDSNNSYAVDTYNGYVYATYRGTINEVRIYDESGGSYSQVANISVNDPRAVEFKDSYAFIASKGDDEIQVYDISDKSNIKQVSNITYMDNSLDIEGSYLYAVSASGDDKIGVYDVTDPTNPSMTDSVISSNVPYKIEKKGDWAVVSGGASTLKSVDVSNKSSISIANSITGPNSVFEIDSHSDGYFYSASDDGVSSIDLNTTDGALSMVNTVTLNGNPNFVTIQNHSLYTGRYDSSGISQIDISDPTALTEVATTSTYKNIDGVETFVEESGDIKVIGAGQNHLVSYTTGYTSGSVKISGTVKACQMTDVQCSDGKAVGSGVVVELLAANTNQIEPKTGQNLTERANEILENASEIKPDDYWNPDLRGNLKDRHYTDLNGKYTAIHSKSDWGMAGWTDSSDLSRPRVVLEPNREYVVSVWDAGKSDPHPYVDNEIDDEMPGRTENGTVVFKQISATGEVTSVRKRSTTKKYETGFGVLGRDHQYATVSLPPGFYRVHPEGNENASYTIAVGNPEDITQGWKTDLKDKAGNLTSQANDIADKVTNDKLKRVTLRTDSSGQFETNLSSKYEVVGVYAYSDGSSDILKGNSDPSLQDLRSGVKSSGYEGSVYLAQKPKHYQTPVTDANIYVREVKAPTFMDLPTFGDLWDKFENLLLKEDYSGMMGDWYTYPKNADPSNASDEVKDRTRDYYQNTRDQIDQNDDIEQEVKNRLNATEDELDDANQTIGTLRDRISTMEEVMRNRDDNISVSDPETDISEGENGQGLADVRVPIDTGRIEDDITADHVTVWATYSDGTQSVVPDEYISIEQPLSETQTYATVSEYPVDNASGVQFTARVVSETGHGKATGKPADNPAVDGEFPAIASIDASTLRPAEGETMSVKIHSDDPEYGSLSDVTVFAPDGTTVNASVSGDTITFTPASKGKHAVEYTVTDTAGTTYTDVLRLGAYENSQPMPAGVRVRESLAGTHTVTGEAVDKATLEKTETGLKIGARVSDGYSKPVHIYTHAVGQSETIEVQLMDSTGTAIQQHRSVVIHAPKTGEEATLRRDGTPIVADYGQVNKTSSATVVETYTDDQGHMTLKINNNPTLMEKISYRVDAWIARNDVSIPALSIGVPTLSLRGVPA